MNTSTVGIYLETSCTCNGVNVLFSKKRVTVAQNYRIL